MGYERGNVTEYLGQSQRVTKMYDFYKNRFFRKKKIEIFDLITKEVIKRISPKN